MQTQDRPCHRSHHAVDGRFFHLLVTSATLLCCTSATAAPPDAGPIVVTGRVVDVDGRPAANAIVSVRGLHALDPPNLDITADADGRFELSVSRPPETLANLRVQATSDDGARLGYFRFPWLEARSAVEPIEIQLGPAKVARIRVVDAAGQSVADAHVAVQLDYPQITADATTSASGEVSLRVPQSERIEAVVAWKDDEGLDYRLYSLPRDQQADVNAKVPEFPLEGQETLTLSGAAPLTVRVVDDAQKPLEGVNLSPWLLTKTTHAEYLNLSYFAPAFRHRTDANGETTFRWLPEWQKSLLTVWGTADGFVHTRGDYDPSTGNGRLEMQLHRLVPIRGRVVNANGQPQGGIAVAARGAGYGMDDSSATAVTDSDGRYELLVAPNQIYLVVVSDPHWAAASHDGFAVLNNQPVDNKDFTLRKPTRVFGTLTDEATGEPLAGERVIVYQYGRDLNSLPGVALPNPEGSRRYVRPIHFYNTTTDDKGRFEFALGDGQFDIRPPQQEKADKFAIAGEEEVELQVTTIVRKPVELSGKVTADDGQPVAAARITGVSRDFRGRDWQAVTTAEGRFRVERLREATFIHAISSDGQRAAIAELGADQDTIDLQLQTVGSATGRLLTSEGDAPLAGTKIDYGVRVPDAEDRIFSYRFGGTVVTDAAGAFRLDALVPGWEYTLNLQPGSSGSIPTLTAVTTAPDETVELGDLPAPKPRAPYVPPTLADRVQSAFAVEGTPRQRYERAMELVQLVNQHLLVVFGLPDDPRIQRLMEIRFEDADYRTVSDEFRIMAIPTDAPHRDAAQALAEQWDESLADGRGDFLLVVLDRDGKKVASADGDALCVENTLSKDKLLELLRGHLTEPLDAKQLLSEALQRAAAENKRVIIQETATWCPPCHLLSRFLDANRLWEKDYIWVKMDHRWTGARELMQEIRDGAEGGIPWFAILDAEGQVLATSNDPKTKHNIGYPSEKQGQVHFATMLNATRQRLTEADVQQLIEALAATETGR